MPDRMGYPAEESRGSRPLITMSDSRKWQMLERYTRCGNEKGQNLIQPKN